MNYAPATLLLEQLGSLAEVMDTGARVNFEVNVFGTLNIIRYALPQLRQQRSSTVSIMGSLPGWGVYCATKIIVEGLSEILAVEAAPFGIKVTAVTRATSAPLFLTLIRGNWRPPSCSITR